MLLINGDCESVLLTKAYEQDMAGIQGVEANQFHWKTLLDYVQTKKQAGQVSNRGRFALDQLIGFYKKFSQ
eukprot:4005133-Heterocapsa_arctica.AAC.1